MFILYHNGGVSKVFYGCDLRLKGQRGFSSPSSLWMSESRVRALPAAPNSLSEQRLPADGGATRTAPSCRLHPRRDGAGVKDFTISQDAALGGMLHASVSPPSPPVPGSTPQERGRANQPPCKSAPSLRFPGPDSFFPNLPPLPPQKCEKIAPSGCCFHPGTGPGAGSQESSACERQTWEPGRM